MTYQSFTIILLILGFYFNGFVNATPNSVCEDPGYASLRPCAAGCVGCDSRPDQIAYSIGCGEVPPNECWCRTDLFTVATSFLNSCVSKSCTMGDWEQDYSSAKGFYESYCQGAGFTAIVTGPTSTATSTTHNLNAPTVTSVTAVLPTITPSPSRVSNNGSKRPFPATLLTTLIVAVLSLYFG